MTPSRNTSQAPEASFAVGSEVGHTPGPWRLDGCVIRGQSAKGHERPICEIYREVRTTPETLANAALLLAAPEMFDALHAARGTIKQLYSMRGCEAEGEFEEWVDFIDAAIAKATLTPGTRS